MSPKSRRRPPPRARLAARASPKRTARLPRRLRAAGTARTGGTGVCATIVGVKSTRVWFSSTGSGLAVRSLHKSRGATSSRRNRAMTSATSAEVTGLAFAFDAIPATCTRWLTANAPCLRIASMRPAGTVRLRGGGAFAQSDWSVANPPGPWSFPFFARAAATASAALRRPAAGAPPLAYSFRRPRGAGAGYAIVSMTYASSSSPMTCRIAATLGGGGSSSSSNA